MSSLEVFEINTKGTCLLCLAKCASPPPGDGNNKAFKLLLRYLKVDVFKLIQFSSETLELMEGFENLELKVSLCGECSTMATDFLQLFKDFEKIRLGLDMFADMMQTQIEDGAKVESRVKEYRRLVISSRNPVDLMNASLAEALRKDTVEKCALRLRNSVPGVSINQVKTDLEMATRQKKVHHVSSHVAMEMEPDSVGEDDFHVQDQEEMEEQPVDTYVADEDSENLSDRLNRFRRHAIIKSEPLMGCTLCNKFFRNGSSLSTHLLTVHTRQVFEDKLPPYVSEEDLTSVVRDLLDQRTKFTDGRKHPSGCPICQKGFQNQFWLRRHLLTFHFDKILADLKSKNEASTSHNSKIASLVQKRKPTKSRRRRDASKDRPYQCKYCVTSFTNVASLKTHLQSTHTIHTLAHKLPRGTTEAQLTTVMNSLLASRRNIRNDLLHPCGCPLCPRKFGNGSKLRVHLVRCHMDAISKNVQRSVGPRPQPKVANKLSSAAAPTGKNSLCKCIICGKRFLNQFYLKNHHAKEHSSSNSKPQPPQAASRKVASVQPQRQGQQVHAGAPGTGSGSHQCVPCNRFFTQSSSLHFHQMTTHPLTTFSDQLPLGITEEELKNAVEVVTQRRTTSGKANNKISDCPHCTRYFHHLSQLRAHILQAHMDQVRGILEAELENENELVEINPLTECEVLIKEEEEDEPAPGVSMEALWMSGNVNSGTNSSPHGDNEGLPNYEEENNVTPTLPFTISATTTPRTPQQCQCSICGENFPHRRSLGDHRKKVHNISAQGDDHSCDHCGKVFARHDSLRAHVLTTHTFEELRNQSQIPAATTEDIFKEGFEGLLDEGRIDPIHARKGKKYDCVVCNKSYRERWELRLHLARYHLDRVVSKLETLISAQQPSHFSELPFAAYNWSQVGEQDIIDVEDDDEDEPAVQILEVRGSRGEISDEQHETDDPLYPE